MNWLSAVSSFGYSIGQIGFGLLVHPYQTMQSLLEEKVFVWMSLLPMGVLAILTVSWRYVIVPSVRLLFSCSSTGFFGCDWLRFISNWTTFFVVYWQLLLVYLLFRFWLTWKQK